VRPKPRRLSFVRLTFTAIATAVLIGGTVTALRVASAGDGIEPGPAPVPAAAESATTTADPSVDPIHERAGRAELRGAPPRSRPTAPAPTRTPPAGNGSIVSSGTCQASYYASGRSTANGEPFDPSAFTAAHRTLAFNTRVRVTNPSNGKTVVVRINDRGPFVAGRCLDLSQAAFGSIASLGSGVATVHYEVMG
jgi:rare lipoprotein A